MSKKSKKIVANLRKAPELIRLQEGDSRGIGYIRIGPDPNPKPKPGFAPPSNPRRDNRPFRYFKTENEYADYVEAFNQREMDNFARLSGLLGRLL